MPETAARSRLSEKAAHRLAEPRPREQESDEDDRGEGDRDRDDLREREPDHAAEVVDLEDVDIVLPGLRAPDEEDDVPDHERKADRHEQQRHHLGPAAPEGAPEAELEGDAHHRGRDDGEDDGGGHRPAERHVDRVGHVRAEDEVLAVGEVDDLEDAVHEREPDGGDRDDRARDEPVGDQLEELAHRLGGAYRSPVRLVQHARRARPEGPVSCSRRVVSACEAVRSWPDSSLSAWQRAPGLRRADVEERARDPRRRCAGRT